MLLKSNTIPMFQGPEVHENFDPSAQVVLHCGDTLEFLETVPNDTAKLIITSPPYNLGKEYENKTTIKVYLDIQEQVIDQLVQKLRPDGSLC